MRISDGSFISFLQRHAAKAKEEARKKDSQRRRRHKLVDRAGGVAFRGFWKCLVRSVIFWIGCFLMSYVVDFSIGREFPLDIDSALFPFGFLAYVWDRFFLCVFRWF